MVCGCPTVVIILYLCTVNFKAWLAQFPYYYEDLEVVCGLLKGQDFPEKIVDRFLDLESTRHAFFFLVLSDSF